MSDFEKGKQKVYDLILDTKLKDEDLRVHVKLFKSRDEAKKDTNLLIDFVHEKDVAKSKQGSWANLNRVQAYSLGVHLILESGLKALLKDESELLA